MRVAIDHVLLLVYHSSVSQGVVHNWQLKLSLVPKSRHGPAGTPLQSPPPTQETVAR